MTQDRKLSLLLEIGTEEIPARFLPPASAMLKENAGSILRDSSVDFSDMKTYATPRRLALIVGGSLSKSTLATAQQLGHKKVATWGLLVAVFGFAWLALAAAAAMARDVVPFRP